MPKEKQRKALVNKLLENFRSFLAQKFEGGPL